MTTTQSIQRLVLQLSCTAAAAWLFTGCGGGSDASSDTTAAALQTSGTAVAAAATTAPAPDSASVNGDVPMNVAKAAQREALNLPPAGDVASSADPAVQQAAVPPPLQTAPAHFRALAAGSGAQAHFIYVALAGNDAWSGTSAEPNAAQTDGPVRTLAAAQTIARARLAAMASGAPRMAVRVRIASGTYYLSAPLEFTPADSGTPEAMVSYEAMGPDTVISGGVPLTRIAAPAPGNAIRFSVPASAGNGWKGGGQLFVDAQRAVLARQPNVDQYWFVKNKVALPSEAANEAGREAFTTSPEALSWLNALGPADRARAILNVKQAWTDGHHRLSDQATPAGSVRVTPRALSPFMQWGLSQRSHVENIAAALDAPGEWLWDSSGVTYIPTSTTSATANAVMPVLDKLIAIRGDHSKGHWVQNIWFGGLEFAHTRHLIPDGGMTDSQAGIDVGAAIEMDGAVGIVVDHCKFSQTSGYGVWFRRSVRDSRVTNSTFTDMGGGALKLGQAMQPLHELPTGANSVVANIISDTGKVFPGAVGIWLGQGFDNLVANNAILRTSYTGISIGWTWGYDPATSGRNRILNNLLSHIGQGQLSDLGGIYTVGISPGTVISGNVIREVRGYPGYGAGAWGIYNDEGASNNLVENNIVVGTDSGGYHLNYGRDNVVRNNVFALGSKFEFRVTNTDPQRTRLAFDSNVMVPSVQQPFDEFAMAPDVIFNNVRVSNGSSGGGLNLAKCGSACSVIGATITTGADPRHVALLNADSNTMARVAQIAKDSGPWQLVSPAVVVEVPSVPPPPPVAVAPPTPLVLDIAGAATSTQPNGVVYHPADPAVIGVVRDATAPGGSCVAFRDNNSFAYSFLPYFYTSLNHDRGVSTAEFSLKIDATTNILYEWRDGGNPYKSGPAMLISPNGVMVKGRIVAPAPVGQWLTFRVIAPVADPNGSWTLEVVNNSTGVTTRANDLVFQSAGWSKLIWMGLMSVANTTSTPCLGNFKVTSSIL